jgi:methionine-rich copper-binding protein CopC
MKTRAVLAIVVLAAAMLPDVAGAHALLVRTSPPKRAVLRDPPKQVELWFNERLEPAYSAAKVSTQSGSPVSIGRTSVGGNDSKRLLIELPPLAPGSYTVRFRVLSVDGHLAEDSFVFSVRHAKNAPARISGSADFLAPLSRVALPAPG